MKGLEFLLNPKPKKNIHKDKNFMTKEDFAENKKAVRNRKNKANKLKK